MKNSIRRGTAALAAGTAMLIGGDASALMFEQVNVDGDGHVYFYPYPTSYTEVDPAYAFDDDPMHTFVNEPYLMPIDIDAPSVLRGMVQPRTSFVHEMTWSAELE